MLFVRHDFSSASRSAAVAELDTLGVMTPSSTSTNARWCKFFIATVTLNLLPLIVVPTIAHGGFQLSVLLLALIPIAWALVLLLMYRTPRERFVCYASILVAILPGLVLFEQFTSWWIWH